MTESQEKRVLLFEQGFLKGRHGKPVHGVELFRLRLIRELAERGIGVTVYAERSWRGEIEQRLGGVDGVQAVYVPNLGGALPNGIVAALRAGHGPWDAVVFGDARRGLIPTIGIACARGLGQRRVLFAHRRPHPRVIARTRKMEFDIVAVSEFVAQRWRDAGGRKLDVSYGVSNAGRFRPAEGDERGEDGLVRFCLLGRLPNISKKHDVAIEAFGMMPADIRAKCRLHLASFIEPTRFEDEGVIAHEWIGSEEVPAFLRGMDAMLTISNNETFSQAIVQGMLTELPIIATSLPVYVEKLDTGCGIIADGAEAISEAMVKLAQDAALRKQMGEIGRATALQRYCWDTDDFVKEYLFPE